MFLSVHTVFIFNAERSTYFPSPLYSARKIQLQQHGDTAVPRKYEKKNTFLPLFHFALRFCIQGTLPISCIWTKRGINVCGSLCNHVQT